MFLHTIISGLNPFSKIFVWEAYTHVVTIWVRQKPLRRFFHAEPLLSTILSTRLFDLNLYKWRLYFDNDSSGTSISSKLSSAAGCSTTSVAARGTELASKVIPASDPESVLAYTSRRWQCHCQRLSRAPTRTIRTTSSLSLLLPLRRRFRRRRRRAILFLRIWRRTRIHAFIHLATLMSIDELTVGCRFFRTADRYKQGDYSDGLQTTRGRGDVEVTKVRNRTKIIVSCSFLLSSVADLNW